MKKIEFELSPQDVDDLLTAIEQWVKNVRDDLDDEYFADGTARMLVLTDRLEAL